jgi:hypothetical protein
MSLFMQIAYGGPLLAWPEMQAGWVDGWKDRFFGGIYREVFRIMAKKITVQLSSLPSSPPRPRKLLMIPMLPDRAHLRATQHYSASDKSEVDMNYLQRTGTACPSLEVVLLFNRSRRCGPRGAGSSRPHREHMR